MEHACATITVCFEEPFWIALYERIEAGHCTVCKITGGICPSVRLSQWNTRNGNASTPNGHSGRSRSSYSTPA